MGIMVIMMAIRMIIIMVRTITIMVIMMAIKMIIITEIIIIMDQTTTIIMAITIIMSDAERQTRASALATTAIVTIVTTAEWADIWAINGCTNVSATCNANGHRFLGDTCAMKRKIKRMRRSKCAIQIGFLA